MKAVGIIATSSALLVGAWWFSMEKIAGGAVYLAARDSVSELPELAMPESVFFVGDIMLARDVEKRLSEQSEDYAFGELAFLKAAAAVFGNFEASVPEVHEPTPNMVMKFSVPSSLLSILKTGGITHLSLANNHALDYGAVGYENTVSELQALGFKTFGHPVTVDKDSVTYVEAEDKRLAIIGINTTFGDVSETWKEVITEASNQSDLQVIFIHWGVEYELTHHESQELLAHQLVDWGADLVVGHHPHVVQDIELYRDRLIFYSLGNFIFDQYWNDDVSEGLVLELSVADGEAYVSLLPVESRTTRVRPRLMSASEQSAFLKELAARSSKELKADIARGQITLQF